MEEHESKAVQAVASNGGKAVDAITEFGRFLGKVVGTVPQDAVGLVIGDWLHEVRARNLHRMQQRTEEILREREAVRIQPVSPTLAIPLFKAAQDESRSELQELWARLLANAMDGTRSGVRKSFIEAVQGLDPADALVLFRAVEAGGLERWVEYDDWPRELKIGRDELEVSLQRLKRLECLESHNNYMQNSKGVLRHHLLLSAFGRELMRSAAL